MVKRSDDMIDILRRRLAELGDPKTASFFQTYFQTQPGGYGEGDVFIGVRVPAMRRVAREYRDLPPPQLRTLLRSPVHEHRFTALLILQARYARATPAQRQRLHRLYLAHTRYINNWDLVDLSAPSLVGAHLDGDASLLLRLARSRSLWRRRIAIVATLHFIRRGRLDWTFRIAEVLLADGHDLIHKAAGWMLREAGKRDPAALRSFLHRHHNAMPRTMLRYAIERFPAELRNIWLKRAG